MRIKIEDIPEDISIKDIILEFNIRQVVKKDGKTTHVLENVKTIVPKAPAKTKESEREPAPIPEEMNLNF